MKSLLLSLTLILSFSAQATVCKTDKATNALVKKLSKYNSGVNTTCVRGKNADEMLKDYALRVNEVEELQLINYPDNVPGVDEVGAQYGLAKFPQVIDMVIGYANAGEGLDKKQESEVWGYAKELYELGVKFGYTSDGASVCGVTWPAPLILDVKRKVIYEINLVEGPC